MIAVILNPKSGADAELKPLIAKIEAALPDVQIFAGEAPGHAQRDAADAAERGFTKIVAAGGDGTLNEVLNGILPHADRVQLGLIPLGTGNDFARVLGLPPDVDRALEVLQAGKVRPLDVVRVSGSAGTRHFLNVSAGGFSGTVNEKMTSDLKAAWGPLSYVRGMIEALPELVPFACELTFDDEPPLPISAFNIVIANAPYVAKGIPIAPRADPADGLLDLVAIRECPGARLILLAPIVLTGNHLESEEVFYRRARKVTVNATPPMRFNTDGEVFGETPWTFEVLPQRLTMIAPERPAD